MEAKVMVDEFNKFYHEAIVAELDEDLTDAWMSKLSADVIKLAPPAGRSVKNTDA